MGFPRNYSREDVAQGLRLRLWKCTQKYDPEGCSFEKFVMGALDRQMRNFLRDATSGKAKVLDLEVDRYRRTEDVEEHDLVGYDEELHEEGKCFQKMGDLISWYSEEGSEQDAATTVIDMETGKKLAEIQTMYLMTIHMRTEREVFYLLVAK